MWPPEPAWRDKCGVLLTSARVSGLCQQLGLNKVLQAKRRSSRSSPPPFPLLKLPKAFLQARAGEGELIKRGQVRCPRCRPLFFQPKGLPGVDTKKKLICQFYDFTAA